MIKIITFMDNPPPQLNQAPFRKGCVNGVTLGCWMWDGLKLSGEGGDDTGAWLSTPIRDNTLVAVTDGSYMKELYPTMNSWAFIFEGSAGGG